MVTKSAASALCASGRFGKNLSVNGVLGWTTGCGCNPGVTLTKRPSEKVVIVGGEGPKVCNCNYNINSM